MKTATLSSRSLIVSGASAVLAMAAMAFSSSADARGEVSFSIGIGLPGVQIGVDNAYPVYGGYAQPVYGAYPQPVYVQPAPVYVRPQPVYVQPAPVYVQPRIVYRTQPIYVQPAPVYAVPAPIYYGRPHGWKEHRDNGHRRGHNRGYERDDDDDNKHGRGGRSYNQRGYGQVYYQR